MAPSLPSRSARSSRRHAGTGTQAQHAGAGTQPSHPLTQATQPLKQTHIPARKARSPHGALTQATQTRKHIFTQATQSSRIQASKHTHADTQGHHIDLQCYMYGSLLCSLSPSYCSCPISPKLSAPVLLI